MTLRRDLVAPCGMNCGVCMRYLATQSGLSKREGTAECTGCRPRGKNCAFIKRSCEWLRQKKVDFCFECPIFPCRRLKTLDRRYTTRYSTSLIDNLLQIKAIGVDKWLEEEAEKWKCPNCGGTVSIHDRKCYGCGMVRKEEKRRRVSRIPFNRQVPVAIGEPAAARIDKVSGSHARNTVKTGKGKKRF